MSYFSSSLARHGQYGRRAKVEMPEKTESALRMSVMVTSALHPPNVPVSHHHQVLAFSYYTTSSCEVQQSAFGHGRREQWQQQQGHRDREIGTS